MIRSKMMLLLVPVLFYGCSNTLDAGEEESLSTVISYTLPDETYVKLWVENSYKTTVATLVDEVKPAGMQSANFEAVDSNGNNLPEGIYTYHIETDEHSQSRILHLFYQ